MSNRNFALLFIGIAFFVILAIVFSVNPLHAETNRDLTCNDVTLNIVVNKASTEQLKYSWLIDLRNENVTYLEIVERYFLNQQKIHQFILTYDESELGITLSKFRLFDFDKTDTSVSSEVLISVKRDDINYYLICNFPLTNISNLQVEQSIYLPQIVR